MFGANEIVGKRFFDKKGKLFVTSMFMTLQGEGPFSGKPAFFIRLAKCNLDCHFCFVGATTITTSEHGSRIQIRDAVVGDRVMSWCEKSKDFVKKRITAVHKSETDQLTRLKFKGDHRVISTPDHLYYVPRRGWVAARDLKQGDAILRAPKVTKTPTHRPPPEMTRYIISEVEHLDKRAARSWANLAGKGNETVAVYNLEVEDTHTYVANGLVVHNCDTYFDDGDWMTFDEIDTKIDEIISDTYNEPPKWAKERDMVLVMTGGEPMLQDELVPFLNIQRDKFAYTQVESNGIMPQELPYRTRLVISPKCSEKTERYLKPHKINLANASCLKFVLEDTGEYSQIPDWAHEWRVNTGKTIFISPMNVYTEDTANSKSYASTNPDKTLDGRSKRDEVVSFWEEGLLDREANQRNHEYAAQYCLKHGFTLNLQMHLYASLA